MSKYKYAEEIEWVDIKGGPTRIEALLQRGGPTKWQSSLLGFIERNRDGSWAAFALHFLGNEPNVYYAQKRVEKFLDIEWDQEAGRRSVVCVR